MRQFRLYNSLTGRVEDVQPRQSGRLTFYACGPTVYSYAHIGNFRSFLTADLVVRTARAIGWQVSFVSNITDVGHLTQDELADAQGEDKLVTALRHAEGIRFATIWDLARYYSDAFTADWAVLNLADPDVRPRASEHVAQQIEAIEKLVQLGHAYETEQGVYFSVASFPRYGDLSGNRKASELAGDRGIVHDPGKRDARDFALWKKDRNHLMRWFSPFGWGYPGWHIECTVMAMAYLGESIDIHAGGADNKFPHHECELAQSESLTGKPFARHWLHTGYLRVDGEKMAKSRGNFFTVRDLLAKGWHGQSAGLDPVAVRFMLTSCRYREPFNFTRSQALACARNVRRMEVVRERTERAKEANRAGPDALGAKLDRLYVEVLEAMLDDLNTSLAYASVLQGFSLIGAEADRMSGASARHAQEWFRKLDSLLGLGGGDRGALPGLAGSAFLSEAEKDDIDELIGLRESARKQGNFAEADRIRSKLGALGVTVQDTEHGPRWSR